MGAYIGIDLGTTFSAVSYLDENGAPNIIDNPNRSAGDNITPSCVEFQNDGPVVGQQARAKLQLRGKAFGRFKREMGGSKTYDVNGEQLTPTDLSALVISEMKKIALSEVGEIEKAVVTIPANFANEAREATLAAAKKAGLQIDHIINEPTAAALYYAFQSGEDLHGHYAIYDLGGGTFDVSIIRVQGQDMEVVASNGLHKLGGVEFDEALFKLVSEKYLKETGKALDPLDYTLNQAEKDKISLSTRSKIVAGGDDEIGDGSVTIQIRRQEFEQAISALLAQTEMLCEATLEESKLKADQINQVILVGGSTRLPAVRESIKRVFGKSPVPVDNVDEMVALGAALYAALKSDGAGLNTAQSDRISKMTVSEIANHYFGTIATVHNPNTGQDEQQNSIVIKKGERIPCSVTEEFFTARDNQTAVDVRVTQAGRHETDPEFVKIIWEGRLEDLPPNRPAGQTVEITYAYDANQTMQCTFVDVKSQKKVVANLSLAAGEGEESAIDQFLVD